MRHEQIRKILARNLSDTLEKNNLPFSLYSYQEETLESTINWLNRKRASRCAYVAQATGLGKTVEFSTMVKACQGLRALIIVSSKTLVGQTVRKLAGFTEGTLAHASSLKKIIDVNQDVVATHWKGMQHDVLVATDETFKLQYEKIKREMNPHVIIWDECHWAYSENAQRALDAFPEAIVIGFSATPDYLTTVARPSYAPVELDNGQVLYGPQDRFARTYFPELLDERGVRWGIENEFLAPLAWGQIEFKFSLDKIPVVDGIGGPDYDQAELSRVMEKNWNFIIQTIIRLYKSRQYSLASRFSAAVCPGVAQAYQITKAIRDLGIHAECITAGTSDSERERIFAEGNEGKLKFLASIFALREGWDAPNAEVAMMLRPTKSRVLYMQFMGRVLRKYKNKVALVLDPHFQNTRFAPLSAPVLFGLPGQEVCNGDLLVAPRKRRKVISPYVLEKLQPVLVVEKVQHQQIGKDFYPTLEEASTAARALKIVSQEDFHKRYSQDPRLHSSPLKFYNKDWRGWGGFLGTDRSKRFCVYATWEEASKAAQKLNILTAKQYPKIYKKDPKLPSCPDQSYAKDWHKNGGWAGFLGTQHNFYLTWKSASTATIKLGIVSSSNYSKNYNKDLLLPSNPAKIYRKDWDKNGGWGGFLGTGRSRRTHFYPTLIEASKAVRRLKIASFEEYIKNYKKDPKLPSEPTKIYEKDWVKNGGWKGFLGKDKK